MSHMKKNKVANTLKKIIFSLIRPFIPFIIIIFILILAVCTIIDAVFIQEVQTDSSSMPEVQVELKNKCIDKSEYLNTCHNFKDGELTNYLLDVNGRENDKEVQWSHLYALMAFHNMTNNTEMNENLLNKVASQFESTFIYEKMITKIETIQVDENGNTITYITEEPAYLLVESDTIMGNYKYNYEETIIKNGNTNTTKKVFKNEELIGEKYERLKKYLKKELKIRECDIETDVEIVIQAANGYYDGKENIAWLQGNSIITDGKNIIPKDMFIWPIPGYTNVTSRFRHESTSNHTVYINYIVVLMCGAPIGANFVAMADGIIINASYSNSYGNMVMIDHRQWNCYFVCTWGRNIGQN